MPFEGHLEKDAMALTFQNPEANRCIYFPNGCVQEDDKAGANEVCTRSNDNGTRHLRSFAGVRQVTLED
jgi:hypothetical protein